MQTVTLRLKMAWWIVPYIKSCALVAKMTGMQPDIDKMSRFIMKGVKCKAE